MGLLIQSAMSTKRRSPRSPRSIHSFACAAGGTNRWFRLIPKYRFCSRALRDHFASVFDVIGDRLLAEHVQAGVEAFDGGLVVSSPVFESTGRDAYRIEALLAEHVGYLVIHLAIIPGARFVGPVSHHVANAKQICLL